MVERRVASNPEGMAQPMRPYYSQCVRVESGPLLFIAGQGAFALDGSLVGVDDPAAQARQVIENIRIALGSQGATLADVVHTDVYLRDIADAPAVAAVRMEAFGENGPTAVLVGGVQLADAGMLVEIRAIATVR